MVGEALVYSKGRNQEKRVQLSSVINLSHTNPNTNTNININRV